MFSLPNSILEISRVSLWRDFGKIARKMVVNHTRVFSREKEKESQLLNYVKLRSSSADSFFCGHSLLNHRVDSFITFTAIPRRERATKSYNCQRNAENRCLRPQRALFRDRVKLIARYYSHSASRTVIRSDVSRITGDSTRGNARRKCRVFSTRLEIVQ